MGNPTAAAITQALHNKQEFPLAAGINDLLVVSICSGSSSTAAPSATPSSRGLLLGRSARPTWSSRLHRRWAGGRGSCGRRSGSSRRLAREGEAAHTVDAAAAEEDVGHRAAAGSGCGRGGAEEDADDHPGDADNHHARRPPRARTPPLSAAPQPRSPLPVPCYSPAAKRSKKRRQKRKGKREMVWHADTWGPHGSHTDSAAT
uniref:Uncharacterized protein n=1 Tax=Oryza glumipatula TaxID=40148 RepID=A0A0D9YS67_9ORYZ